MNDKQSLRTYIRRHKQELQPSIVVYKSQGIAARAIEIIRGTKADSILTFAGLPTEPDTRPLLREILAMECALLLPRVEGRSLRLFRVRDLEAQLKQSPPYGIFEPVPDLCEEWNDKPIDLALVPGLAFDIAGNRLGHGGGFFDRTLATLSPRPTIYGLAFEFQMRRSVPHDAHDVRVDGVLTEQRFFRHRSSGVITHSPEATRRLGCNLAKTLPPDSTLVLGGPLGCGKTVFVQGLAQGLGIDEEIVSQTFILAKEYRSPQSALWHADLYRLQAAKEVDMGFWSEIIESSGIKAIEWGDRLGDCLPLDAIVARACIEGETDRAWTIETPLDNQSEIHRVTAMRDE
ncbi:MAG: 5-formyltetrahydrofolate cyclo-ligase [bacterium]